jgi:hypothetical protein
LGGGRTGWGVDMRVFGDPGTVEQAGDVVRMGVNDRAGLRAQETREESSIVCRGDGMLALLLASGKQAWWSGTRLGRVKKMDGRIYFLEKSGSIGCIGIWTMVRRAKPTQRQCTVMGSASSI